MQIDEEYDFVVCVICNMGNDNYGKYPCWSDWTSRSDHVQWSEVLLLVLMFHTYPGFTKI